MHRFPPPRLTASMSRVAHCQGSHMLTHATAPLRTVISWSSGKDSALSLLRLRDDPRYDVVGLYTTHVADGVPYQNTPLEVVQQQAHRLGLPLITIALPEVFPPNPVYQQCVVDGLRHSGLAIDAVAFGDMFHNGIADYRHGYIEPAGWQCVFPLLGDNPADLAREILQRGITTHLITVDTSSAMAASVAAVSMPACWPSCRQRSIRAAKTASSTPWSPTCPALAPPSPCSPVR